MSLKYYEWPDDEHDRFIRDAQLCDTLTELLLLHPQRSTQEVMDKAESMGCLAWLVQGEHMEAGRAKLELEPH